MFALALAKASLTEAAIPYVVHGEEYSPSYFGLQTNLPAETRCRIDVHPENESEARLLLEPLTAG